MYVLPGKPDGQYSGHSRGSVCSDERNDPSGKPRAFLPSTLVMQLPIIVW